MEVLFMEDLEIVPLGSPDSEYSNAISGPESSVWDKGILVVSCH